MSRLKDLIGAVLLSVVFFSFPRPTPAEERDPKIDALANTLAQGIEKKLSPNLNRGIGYLVLDIWNTAGIRTRLGMRLADDVSDALSNALPGLKAVDRAQLRELCVKEAFDPAVFRAARPAFWAARTLGGELAILGTIEPHGDSFVLHLRAIDKRGEEIMDAGERIDWTDELRALEHLEVGWTTRVSPWKGVPESPQRGYSAPKCVHCPNPNYSEEARKTLVQGSLLIQVLIGKDGRVQDAVVLRGLPCGLSKEALATVKTWQFQPVLGPEEKPVEVQTPVEVTFKLF
jgi:TonB family protein